MDTSLAEEVQQTMATLAPQRFFFMSPYRSFTTSGCFARFDEPAINGDSPDSPFQQKLHALFTDAKAQGIANPVMVGAIPFDTRQPSSLFIPQSWQTFSRQEKQRSSRYFTDHQTLNVTARNAIPEQETFEAMVARAAALTATPEVDKVVLSRLIDITTDAEINSGALLERLVAQNPVSYNFHVPLRDGGICSARARNCCCAKKAIASARCRWRAPRAVSLMTYWIGKPETACWPLKKIAMNMSWLRRR